MNNPDTASNYAPRAMIDSYLEWLKKEGLPVTEGLGIDLFSVETKPWARSDVNGAAVHLKGRGDFVNMFLTEIPPARSTSPQQHIYEEVVYVLEGQGSTTIEIADGRKHTFEWGPRSIFAIPLNAKYRHFNGSGSGRALMVSTTNLPLLLNIFHNEKFIFDNPADFDERVGQSKYFTGEGDFIPVRPGNHMWETNFVPDLPTIALKPWGDRGAGGTNIMFILADGTMHAHLSEMPVGTYKKGHRHSADFHVMCVTGQGYSLLWYEGEDDFQRVDWKHGTVFAPPDQMFHQHFNTSPQPSRYLATAYGSLRYPFTESKRASFFGGVSTSLKLGGAQIEYEDQSPRIQQLYEEAAKKNGFAVNMSRFIK
jgi:oxalate decarboxylase/phosphoglucose isomerase-like protein (cupin superfamily)